MYEVMLEVSASRIASALFLCLVVCEDHVAWLEKEGERKRKVEVEREKEVMRVREEEERSEKIGGTKMTMEGSGEGRVDGKGIGSTDRVSTSTYSDVSTSTYSGGVLFHCAQGKDRTGILAMLLTFSLYGDEDWVEERAVREYSVSERLLEIGREREKRERRERERREREERRERGERGEGDDDDDDDDDDYDGDFDSDSDSDSNTDSKNTENTENTETIDDKNNKNNKNRQNNLDKNTNLGEIQSLKGSPPKALRDTLSRVRSRYGGSILGYLDHIGFNRDYRKRLQIAAEKTKKLT